MTDISECIKRKEKTELVQHADMSFGWKYVRGMGEGYKIILVRLRTKGHGVQF
jgi:hypothetical protein